MNAYSVVPFPIVAILGPTAVGKTTIAIKLAQRLKGEIINLDSIQIYKGLDIGSAKPTAQEQAMVPHHLIDMLEPDEVIDAPSFAKKASYVMRNIIRRGKVPVLVGGTGFYLRAIFSGLNPLPSKIPAIRNMLTSCLEKRGRNYLYKILEQVDMEAARKIHKNDTYRLVRALEVYLSTAKTFSSLCREQPQAVFELGSRALIKVGLIIKREELYSRINERVDLMLKQGLIDEVQGLLKKGYSPALKPLQSIGYKHIISYLLGKKDLKETIEELKRDTRHYAKRQITWFKKEPGIRWFNAEKLLVSKDIWKALN